MSSTFILGDQTFPLEFANARDGYPVRPEILPNTEFCPNVNMVWQRMCWRLGMAVPPRGSLPIEQDYLDVLDLIRGKRLVLDFNTGSNIQLTRPSDRLAIFEIDWEGMLDFLTLSQRAEYATRILRSIREYSRSVDLAVFSLSQDGITDDSPLKKPRESFRLWMMEAEREGTFAFKWLSEIKSFIRQNHSWLQYLSVVQFTGYFGRALNDKTTLDYIWNYASLLSQVHAKNKRVMVTISGARNEGWNDGVSEDVSDETNEKLVIMLQQLHAEPGINLSGAFVWGLRSSNKKLWRMFGIRS